VYFDIKKQGMEDFKIKQNLILIIYVMLIASTCLVSYVVYSLENFRPEFCADTCCISHFSYAATYLLIFCREKCLVSSSVEYPRLYLGFLFNSNARFAGNLDLREFRIPISNTAGVFTRVCVHVARRGIEQ
jgi:hypothetical protein